MNAAKVMFAAVLLCQIKCKSHYIEISLLHAATTLLAVTGNVIHIFSFQVNSQFPNIALKYVHSETICQIALFHTLVLNKALVILSTYFML